MNYDVGNAVEILGGSKKWLRGTVSEVVDNDTIKVKLDTPILASFWEGRPRRIDANITEVTMRLLSGANKNIRIVVP